MFLFVYGYVLDRTQAYLTALRLITISVTVLVIADVFVIPAGNVYITCIFSFILGAFLLPIFTVSLPMNILITHPIPSDATNGIMLTGSFIFSTLGSLGGAVFFDRMWYWAMFSLVCVATLSSIAAFIMTDPKLRNDLNLSDEANSKEDMDIDLSEEILDKTKD